MVEGIYRGRGDTTNIRLGDAEVRRIRDSRRLAERDIAALLEAEVARDPTPGELRKHAHLFLVAEPDQARPRMLQDAIGDRWRDWLIKRIRAHSPVPGPWEPRFDSVHQVERRAEGWGMHNSYLHHGRTVLADTREEGLLDVAVTEEGGVRVFCGRCSDTLSGDSTRYVIEQLVSGLAWQTLALAADIAAEARFLGNWHVGVALTNARGVRSYWTKQH